MASIQYQQGKYIKKIVTNYIYNGNIFKNVYYYLYV